MDFLKLSFWEKNFHPKHGLDFLNRNFNVTIYLSIIYVSLLFIGKRFMKNRPAMDMQNCLLIWNILLAVFSILGASRAIPEFLHSLQTYGFKYSVCSFSFFEQRVTGFWTFLFALSKIAELFDTAFIVLRKKKLMFLHWYHHFTVLLAVWYLLINRYGAGRWYMTMNYCVHAVMYTYYSICAAKIKVPRQISILITCMQVLQMVVGLVIALQSLIYLANGTECNVNAKVAVAFAGMYASYLVLFVNFFAKTYLVGPSEKRIKKT